MGIATIFTYLRCSKVEILEKTFNMAVSFKFGRADEDTVEKENSTFYRKSAALHCEKSSQKKFILSKKIELEYIRDSNMTLV